MMKRMMILAGVMILATASLAWADVAIDPEHFEDGVFGPYLFNFDKDGDGVLSDSEIANITGLNLSGMGISAIEGLQYLTSLQSLDCTNNNLAALDLSGNTALTAVSCDSQIRNLLAITSSGNTSYPYQLDFTNYMTSAQTANVSNVQGLDSSGNNILTIYANGVAMFAARPGSVTYSYNTGHNSQNMSVTLSAAVEINPNNFPDEVFGPYLFNFDTDGDGVLSAAEIEAIDGIHVQDMGIKSLKGIRYLTAIKQLNCSNNSIESLDVHGLTELEIVWCTSNDMQSLDVSGCTALKELYCQQNSIDSFSITGCGNLEILHARENNLTGALDLHEFTKLVDVSCRSNMLTSVDVHGCSTLKILNARSNQLQELNITECDALEELNCQTREADDENHTNHITALDLSGKSNLRLLNCWRNGITALDLTDCTALVSVDCCRNQLASLNVAGCTELEYLVCGSNDLKSLDVTHNTKLTHLEAYACRLEALDLSQNTELDYLDLGAYYNDRATRNRISTLDLTNNTKLKTIECDNNELATIDVSKLTQLERLVIGVNNLTTLDVSKNTALTYLVCRNNKLTELDISANTLLQTLRCYSNDITALDLSNNPLISDLQTGASGIMSEIPKLTVKYSPDINMPYTTDMKDYVGENFTDITSLKGYTSAGSEISSSFMADGTASFAQMPVKVVYTYDTGYTGSADISADIKIALVPDPDNFFSPLTVISREPVASIEPYPVPVPYPISVVSIVISRETVVIVSIEVSPEIHYIHDSDGGCNALSGTLILAFLTGLTGFVFTPKKD